MTKYRINDGRIFDADNATQLVSQMHRTSFDDQAESDAAYMDDVSKRAYQASGCPVRCGSPEDFVTDMIAAGLIKKVK